MAERDNFVARVAPIASGVATSTAITTPHKACGACRVSVK